MGGLYLDLQLMPYAGTLALTALLAFALATPRVEGRSRRAGLIGLASLALTAGLVDADTDGFGWPAEFPGGSDLNALAESGSLILAAGALTVAVLDRSRLRPRWWHPPAAIGAVLVLWAVCEHGRFSVVSRDTMPDLTALGPLLALSIVIVLALSLVMTTTLASRGPMTRAGAGLFPVLVLVLIALVQIPDNDLLRKPRPAPPVAVLDRDSVLNLWQLSQGDAYGMPARGSLGMATLDPLPAPPKIADIDAVTGSPFAEDRADSWPRAKPAILAALLLLAMVALATSLFPVPDDSDRFA
ncbi:hypothetical protein Ahu01nite_031000 [Winogradskya humida]|uniref:Uncharacterized protein n=1 Tax=Winogradskya humida TaxID=113566 RepID=A0ABQ3ZN28_9ACTN|nr:hypothetical protein Ahu01nite_031000 [Actinoplanes humidus]